MSSDNAEFKWHGHIFVWSLEEQEKDATLKVNKPA